MGFNILLIALGFMVFVFVNVYLECRQERIDDEEIDRHIKNGTLPFF